MKRQLKMMFLLLACSPIIVQAQLGISDWALGRNPFLLV